MSLRRLLIASAAASMLAGAAAAQPAPVPQPTPAPMVSSRAVGQATVTTILDGRGEFPLAIFQNIDAALAVPLLQAGREFIQSAQGPAWHGTVSAFVVDIGGRRVLIDTGVGGGMGGIGGRLPAGLAAAGVAPESIQLIVISHFHGDHIGGLLAADGSARFPRATLRMHRDELAYWTSAEQAAAAPAQMRGAFETAGRIVAAYGDRVRPFTSGELAPGLTAEPAVGHTPGHTVYRLSSGGQEMVFIGDMIHAVSLQAPRPEVSLAFDQDAAAARRVRDAFTARAAEQRTLIAAPHFPFPGIGRLERAGAAYRYVPVPPPQSR